MFILLPLWLNGIIAVASAAGDLHVSDNESFSYLGSVWLYEHTHFKGDWQRISVRAADTCYFLSCIDNMISSASWSLPNDGNFANTIAYLAFSTDANCSGTVHLYDLSQRNSVPTFTDGSELNDRISAVMLMKTKTSPLSVTDPCSPL